MMNCDPALHGYWAKPLPQDVMAHADHWPDVQHAFCCEVLPGYTALFIGDRISDDEAEKIATLMASAPALKAMVERLISECRGRGFGQLVMDAEFLLKELNHGK